MLDNISYNQWCGEEAAIREFNFENELRKIQRNDTFAIPRFHVCHVLDHPIRTGSQKVRPGFPLQITRI